MQAFQKNKSQNFIIISLICLFLIIGAFLFLHKSEVFTVSAAGENWLSSWSKRKTITITSNAALTNYQVLITVAYDSDMQADFDDLRFTSSDGSTLINYWIESKTDSSTAKVWIKVPSLIASTNTIYMYYGNVSITSGSNGTNTFDFFDDFSAASIDTNKWTITNSTGWSIIGGELKGTNTTGRLTSIATFSSGAVLKTKSRTVTLSANGYHPGGFCLSTSNRMGFLRHPGDHYRNNGTWVSIGVTSPLSTNILTNIVVKSSSAVDLFVTNYSTGASYVNISNISNAVESEPIVLGKRYDDGYSGQTYEAYWDWIFVHKYAAVEPTSVFGTEEALIIPVLAQITAVPTPTADTTPSYTFSSTKAGTITYSGSCSSATTTAIAGNNTITFNALAVGIHSNCTIKVTDSLGNQSTSLTVNSFTINLYNSTTSTSANLSCFVTSGTCTGTTVFKLYDYLDGHAELSSQSNYLFKV
jgi:hypothetical protein